jgi:peptide/nickel transport system substrate-binding protein
MTICHRPPTGEPAAAATLAVLALPAWRPEALAQSRKDSVVLGMVLEPPGLDPTMAPAAAIGEIVHYNVLEGLTKVNRLDGASRRCWPRAGRWTPDGKTTPSSCARA